MTTLSAVVLCAGKGTRMKSEQAKVLHSVLGRPLAAYPLARAFELGASPVVAVVGHQAETVQKQLSGLFAGSPLQFALQAEQRGTAHAVQSAQALLEAQGGDVLILSGDVPLVRTAQLQQLVEAHRKSGALLTLTTFRPASPTGYGRIVRDGHRVTHIVEEKDASPAQRTLTECNAGLYVVKAELLWRGLADIKPNNAQGELYLTDLVAMAAARGQVEAVEAPVEDTAGVNDRRDLAQAAKLLQRRINTRHLLAGVSLADPETAYLGEDVQIGTDTELGPQVQVLGKTVIGKNVQIAMGCVITDSTVADGTVLKPYTVLEEARVGAGGILGPFSRLRPGTVLAEGVHLGNFVETKKAVIGKGSKANHLAYLGDALIGAGVNVGAGTITCNYDGVNKHTTTLGDGVFIGSDTQLVAPVTVGRGAYIGAGSTITKDVPEDALALSRPPQVVKEGLGARIRAKHAGAKK
jgi:bifunctional UDP-N-acetylglucosamine pyrophosphorylase/glucosamine-1-phosphate N-acetyltransferase